MSLDFKVSVRMQGLEEFEQMFKQFSVREQRKVLVPIFKKASKSTVQTMKSMAPVSGRKMKSVQHSVVSKGQVTFKNYNHGAGELKRSIGITVAKKSPTIYLGPRSTTKNDGWYYKPLSLGHRQFVPTGKKGGSRQIGFTKGNDFLIKAWERTRPSVLAIIKNDVSAYLIQRSNGRKNIA